MTTIITKNSSTASAVPSAGALVQGELAVNVTDKKLYTKDSGGTVQKLVGSLGNQEANAVAITGGTESGVAITGGTINNTPIGATTAAAVTGTLITATTGFSGPLTGAVTGNTTGTHTGNVTGDVTGNVTGNITASSGSSSFNNVTINGTLDMNAGTTGTITGLAAPTNSTDAATKSYVDTAVANVVASAPAALDTLNELAAALGNDANFATSVATSIGTKVSKSGDSMTGNLSMGTNKVTGLGTPTAGTDAANKSYVDTADALRLSLSGGTMTGNIVMGANKITSTATPTTDDDLTRKAYVDAILGSGTSAAASAAAAATSATNAANSASSASTSASSASASATAAAASYDSFDDRYLGAKTSDPSLDNDGNALLTGAIYWNTTSSRMRAYTGTAWADFYPATNPVEQTDIGTAANEIPLNQYLGNMAWQDSASISVGNINAASQVLTIGNGQIVKDASGNLGLGVTPSAWSGLGGSALELTQQGNGLAANPNALYYNSNAYYATGWKYAKTGYATQYVATNNTGVHAWFIAPSGTAGNAITFTQAMTLDASGNLLVGRTAAVGSERLSVNGTGRFETAVDLIGGAGTPELRLYQNAGNWSVRNSAGALAFYDLTNSAERARIDASGNLLVGLTSATGTAKLQVSGPLRTTGYTVATLPAGTVGMRTYVTDASAPSFGATVVGGGAVTIPVFYNGTNWIVA